jgi:hypothetical protein
MSDGFQSVTSFTNFAATQSLPQQTQTEQVQTEQATLPQPLCQVCNVLMSEHYYMVQGRPICSTCAAQLKREIADSPFGVPLALGLAAAVVGLFLYAGFRIATGISIGYIALAVGLLVGKAMMMGSRGVGGGKYAAAAVILTYLSIAMAYVPIWVAYRMQIVPAPVISSPLNFQPTSADGQSTAQPQPQTEALTLDQLATPQGLAWLGRLSMWGLVSPFLPLLGGDLFRGLMRLLILAAGLTIAAKTTQGNKKWDLDGPYPLAP